jgi:hypothetical protein
MEKKAVLTGRSCAPAALIVVSILAVAFSAAIGQPALGGCPARISSASIIGRTTSGASSVYAVSVDIEPTKIPEPTVEVKGMHLYVRDDAGNETWIFVPDHRVSDWNHGRHLDYFSFGWRLADRFQINIADLTVGDSPTVVCGNDWQSGGSVSDVALDAGITWDDWSAAGRRTVDLVAFHPAQVVNEAAVRMHQGEGPDAARCEIQVSVDSAGRPTAFDVFKTSGYQPYDNECIDAAKRSTYKSASFGPTSVASTWLVEWAYVRIQ